MDIGSLDRDAAQRLAAQLRSRLDYIARVRGRMEELHFDTADSLYRAVVKAHESLRDAWQIAAACARRDEDFLRVRRQHSQTS